MTTTPISLPRAEHGTAADAATRAIFTAIYDGTLQPGTPLRLQALADQLGLSMMPVREALRRLEALGLVDLQPHKGARVREQNIADLTAAYEVRFILEGAAVRMAAASFTLAHQAEARQALADRARYLADNDHHRARDAHERFHFAIYNAVGNPRLTEAILPLWRNTERYRLESFRHPNAMAERTREHDEILSAVIAGDADSAEHLIINHLRTSMNLVAAQLKNESTDTPKTSG